jgi:geranylgeranyl reductase family protein
VTDPNYFKVAVLGAGPGGAVASLCLSAKGIEHAVVDKAVFPRDKICGDAFSGKVVDALKGLDIDYHDAGTQLPSWGVTFIAPNGKALRVPFNTSTGEQTNAPGFIAKRMDFDTLLFNKLKQSEHAVLMEGTELRTFDFKDNAWHCSDRSGKKILIADHLIVADGAQSTFAKKIGAIKQEAAHYAAGIRTYYKGVEGLDHENFIELHFLEEFVPGYLWIFPMSNGMSNVGVGLRSDLVKSRNLDLKKIMFELIENHPALKKRFAHAEMVDGPRGWGLPFGSKKRKISGNQFVLVGDAASLIDPFTGEGIGNAMISGKIAAEVIAGKLTDPALNLSVYDERVYAKLWKELHLSHRLQQLATKKWLFNWLVNKATTNKTLSHMISNMFMDIDLRDQLKQPSFYFKLLTK